MQRQTMLSQLTLCFLVGLAYASNPCWKDNTEYVYHAHGRTLASLHEVSDQYSGINLKAKLRLQPKGDGKIQGQISDAQYSQVHTRLQNWNTYIPDAELSWKPLEISKQPFQVEMKLGVISDVIVSKEVSNWEANLIKSFLSQFQLNIDEHNTGKSSSHPDSAMFMTMEDTVTGNVQTLYKINPLPDYVVKSEPWGEQALQNKGDGKVIEITKHKDYNNSHELPSYSYGFGSNHHVPGSNLMGGFFVRDSTSRAIISGSLKKCTIQQSYTVNSIMANPTLQDKQKGSVQSIMNVTLEQTKGIEQPIGSVSQPVRLGNLVYSYGSPFEHDNKVQEKSPYQQPMYNYGSNDISQRGMYMHMRAPRSLDPEQYYDVDSRENSEESYKKSQPKLEDAPESPLLPLTVGYSGVSIKKATDVPKEVKTLAQEIGNDLQDRTRNLQETLSKTTTLSSLLRLLNSNEMQKVAAELYSNEEEGPKRDTWQVYRDCVAETGTPPALLTVENWIQSQKLKNHESAWVLARMMHSVRQPTPKYIKTLFELVKSNQVQQEWPLNASALLSYSELVHNVYVNTDYSRRQYPVKSFKRFDNEEGKKYLKEAIIPHYRQQLDEAISQGQTAKIHVYIRALGNIGHPEILQAFEPYLEGKKQASQFQRGAMVLALDTLSQRYPKEAQKLLFRVYQNPGETEDVRVIAVHRLMYSQPKAEILQYMASYTNVDVHENVNAAVKQSIEEASQLKGDHYRHFRTAAESARPLLNNKEYGIQQGYRSHNTRHFIEELGYAPEEILFSFGSEDSFIPKGVRYMSTNNYRGKRQGTNSFTAWVSSINELVHVAQLQTQQQFQDKQQQNQHFEQQKGNQWSSQRIASLLNLERENREQLEGTLIAGFGEAFQMISFDNRTIEQYTRDWKKYEDELRQGMKMNFIKLVNRGQIALSFPTEMGLPFLFTRDTPTLMRAKGTIKATMTPQMLQDNRVHKPDSIKIMSDVSVTLSGKTEGQLSFVTPFDHHQYIAGYDKHWQVFVPVQADIEVDVKQGLLKAEIQPCKDHHEISLLQYTTQPYTSRIDITNFQPISAQPNTHPIEQVNTRTHDQIFGERQTGIAMRLQMRHERQFLNTYKIMKFLKEEEMIGGFYGLWNDAEVQQSQLNITHLVDKSTTKKIVIRLGHQEEYYKNGDSSAQQLSDSDDPQQRQKQAMKAAAAGIKSVRSQVFDASLEFQGDQDIKYHATGAFAKSNVDPKSKVIAEFRKHTNKQDSKPYMISLEVKNEVPNTNGLDLEYSMQHEPKVDSEMKLVFGEDYQSAAKINANWQFRRSEERKQYMREQPNFRQCQQEEKQGNKQSGPCVNVTIDSNFLDRVDAQVQHENLDRELKETLKTIYYGLRLENLANTEVDTEDKSGNQNQIKLHAAFDPDFRSMNVSLKTSEDKTTLRNLDFNEYVKQIAVLHPVFHLKDRLMGKALGNSNYRPACVVDRSKVKTFNNLTIPAEISKSWTVMLQYTPHEARHGASQNKIESQLMNQVENYAVLVRQNSQNGEKKDIKITLSTPKTEFKVIDITMNPEQSGNSKAKVTVDGQQVQISDMESHDVRNGYIEIYGLPNGEVKLEVRNAFYVLYDGERVRFVPTSGKFKDANRGICGQFTNSRFEDLVAPADCYVRDHKKFVKSYEIEGQEGQATRQELSNNEKECARKQVPLYVNVMDAQDKQSGGRCTHFQTRYIEQSDEICFTSRSIPVCKSGCQPRGTVTQDVPVHCIKSSPVAQIWKSQIDRGANPDFSHKKETKSVPMQLPESCVE